MKRVDEITHQKLEEKRTIKTVQQRLYGLFSDLPEGKKEAIIAIIEKKIVGKTLKEFLTL